ncbi:MAG: Uma2 family endonuclease [Pleurocapsa sp. SU_196_0]|nr:Uma2 family endonuclease [Pleurocapsa sp. SU_196_0]
MTAMLEKPESKLQGIAEPHRFTGLEYRRIAESGVFPAGQRTELIRGEIYFMSAMGAAHYKAIKILTRLLSERYSSLAFVVPQAPIIVWDDSEPEPDFVLLTLESDAHPAPARDVLLAIEVSDSTLKYDQHKKLPEYARSGIPETWILNLIEGQLEVYRQPDGEQYLQLQIVKPQNSIAPLFAPEVTLEWWTALETREAPADG